MTGLLTTTDASALAAIINAAVTNQQVGRLIDEKVVVGTARNIGDENGNFLDGQTDIRDGYLHVTMRAGWEVFWAVRDLMPQYLTGEFVVGYEG